MAFLANTEDGTTNGTDIHVRSANLSLYLSEMSEISAERPIHRADGLLRPRKAVAEEAGSGLIA